MIRLTEENLGREYLIKDTNLLVLLIAFDGLTHRLCDDSLVIVRIYPVGSESTPFGRPTIETNTPLSWQVEQQIRETANTLYLKVSEVERQIFTTRSWVLRTADQGGL